MDEYVRYLQVSIILLKSQARWHHCDGNGGSLKTPDMLQYVVSALRWIFVFSLLIYRWITCVHE